MNGRGRVKVMGFDQRKCQTIRPSTPSVDYSIFLKSSKMVRRESTPAISAARLCLFPAVETHGVRLGFGAAPFFALVRRPVPA